MLISEILSHLEAFAPLSLQESYDNSGLLTGDPSSKCTGVLSTLDVTEAVIVEAVKSNCNLLIAHHPLIFSPLKSVNIATHVGKTLVSAIKQDVAIYALHTNLDNVIEGVNRKIADKLELLERKILLSKEGTLEKIFTYVPHEHLENVRNALFNAGAGTIGRYEECSFSTGGSGTFRAGSGTKPYVGTEGKRHIEPESKLEVIFPRHLRSVVTEALLQAHPYEEVAYEVMAVKNNHPGTGSGITGILQKPFTPAEFLALLKQKFGTGVIRHTTLNNKDIRKVAVCGGAGSFLIPHARKAAADAYVSADFKYHDFFETDQEMMICDIGHFESEQYTIDLIAELLQEKFPTFAVLKSAVNTNPVRYFA